MEIHSDWYNRIIKDISSYQDTLSKKEFKKYKLDLLLRIAQRVDSFSTICGECQLFQPEITSRVQSLGNLLQMPSKEERKSYFKMIGVITKHLQKQHKLVNKGQYMGIGLAIGVGIGTALGAALDNTGIGPGVGIALGVLFGIAMDKKAEKEGRVI